MEGVLRAYKAGSFFADHGHIARNVEFRVEAEGLSRPAYAGETIAVSSGSHVTVELNLDVPSGGLGRRAEPDRPDRIDRRDRRRRPDHRRRTAPRGKSVYPGTQGRDLGICAEGARAADRSRRSRFVVLHQSHSDCHGRSEPVLSGVQSRLATLKLAPAMGRRHADIDRGFAFRLGPATLENKEDGPRKAAAEIQARPESRQYRMDLGP